MLIGEYSYRSWCGSATSEVLQHIALEIGNQIEVFVYELPVNCSRIVKYFSPLREKKMDSFILITGGLLPLLHYLFCNRPRITHFVVQRRYMLLLLIYFRLLKTKQIITLHDTIIFREKIFFLEYFIKRLFISLSDLILLYNYSDYKLINRFKQRSSLRIIINGVDMQSYKPQPQQESKSLILFAGGLSQFKGAEFFLNAIRQLGIDEFLICGEPAGDYSPDWYSGPLSREEFRRVLCRSSFVVVPSRYESFSLTSLETMASGVPLVLTRTTGIAGYLIDKYDCLKIDYGDTAELINAIKTLQHDKRLYMTIRKNALETVKRFSWKSAADGYCKIYRSL